MGRRAWLAVVGLVACGDDGAAPGDGNPGGEIGSLHHRWRCAHRTPAAQFAAPATGDLHLLTSASGALDQGIAISSVTTDYDGEARGATPDLGADER